ncbi:uncharacterized protein MCYG_01546 [Microsporum canis CBS 113480]|uniref:HNH nuclease domain-containing protein n=1 Tax=Arthroderma otae (strain ATCC MYA-4605 / CBS 113480) TaxID=554155 RepID=C5FHI7_ARTOC|nr:uncharacterized protein MCYG_01546 [Microsporum canis CBS 113480]EEQ28727.1 predicted protein [Microsporum canis CBS 113480]
MAGLDYYEEYQKGLRHALSWKDLAEEEYYTEPTTLDQQYIPVFQELQTIKRQSRTVAHIEEELGLKLMDRYINMSQTPTSWRGVWCHLTGAWYTAKYVRAANLVPKTPRGDELKHLFGVGEVFLEDPRNGITLWRTLEQGLDNGTIAIILRAELDDVYGNWAAKSLHSLPTIAPLRGIVRICHSAKRASPHQLAAERLVIFDRYLSFHFAITSLYAKKRGDTQWVENIESRKILWASMGPYLAVSLGRDISGLELPNEFIMGKTFDLPAPAPENDLALAASLRAAMIRSTRAADEGNGR